MPDFIQSVNNWIVFIAGVLVIIGGMKYLKSNRSYPKYP